MQQQRSHVDAVEWRAGARRRERRVATACSIVRRVAAGRGRGDEGGHGGGGDGDVDGSDGDGDDDG